MSEHKLYIGIIGGDKLLNKSCKEYWMNEDLSIKVDDFPFVPTDEPLFNDISEQDSNNEPER